MEKSHKQTLKQFFEASSFQIKPPKIFLEPSQMNFRTRF